MRYFFLPLLPILLLAGCATPPSKQPDFRVKYADKREPAVYGEGLNGRMVDGVKVYTVTVKLLVSREGKVVHAEVIRSDAPKRLQWASVKAVKRFKFNPAKEQQAYIQTIRYHGIEPEPD